jgi:uncharacterized protein (DUF362 family)
VRTSTVIKSRVVIAKCSPESDYEQTREAVRHVIELLGGLAGIVKPGDMVLIKPNVVAPFSPDSGAVTNPQVTRAIADIVEEHKGLAVIAESSAVGVDTEEAFRVAGYETLRDRGYRVVNLKKESRQVTVSVKDAHRLSEFRTWELVREADAIINVPVMKTHDQVGLTLGIKNLKGLVSDKTKRAIHRNGVLKGVADLASALSPALTVIDGTIGQEGLGPAHGIPVPLGILLASRDLVAGDTIASVVMGFDPGESESTVYAARKGLGTMNLDEIEVVGEPLANVRRRFLRPWEDTRLHVDGFDILYSPTTCSGCHNSVLGAVRAVRDANQSHCLAGLTVVAGAGVDIPAEIPADRIVTVGICVPAEKRSARHVPGCPPIPKQIVRGLLGDRVKDGGYSEAHLVQMGFQLAPWESEQE